VEAEKYNWFGEKEVSSPDGTGETAAESVIAREE
jgi:hypothetical protein